MTRKVGRRKIFSGKSNFLCIVSLGIGLEKVSVESKEVVEDPEKFECGL